MRRLILFRHAKAEPHESGKDDFDRQLVERGKSDAALIGTYMNRHGIVPDRVLVSTARRAQQTWELAASGLRPPPATHSEAKIYNASADELYSLVVSAPDSARTLMLVGHNPGLHELALTLVATGDLDTREKLREEFPTAAMAVIDFVFSSWSQLHPLGGRLERFVSPRTLADKPR